MSNTTNDDRKHGCKKLQHDFFADRSLIVAANRGPVTFNKTEEGKLEFEPGGGGLVKALLGLCQHTEATWIACNKSQADAEWGQGEVPLDESGSSVQVHFLTPDPAAYHMYYGVISNPLLWFLQHSMWDVPRTPIIDRKTWQAWDEGYVALNRMFGQAIAEHLEEVSKPPVIMLQDYHLYLAGHFLREQMEPDTEAILMHFVHIPWPGPEYWRILPPRMRHGILEGLCSTDLLGFQTREDGLNFIRTCESELPDVEVNFRDGWVRYSDAITYVRDYPISIDVEAVKQLAESDEVAEHRSAIERIVQDWQMILRVDRIEPSKNILRGFQAYAEMLELYPEHLNQVKLLSILVPSRLAVDEYYDYLNELMATAGQINARYGNSRWEPIRLLVGEDYPRAIAAMQLYDVLLVNVVDDGMNLVAKEGPIVNRRHGSLILSERAGARQQLGPGATIVSPCDIYDTAEALHKALIMDQGERQERAIWLREQVEAEDIADWLCRQLETMVELEL